MRYPQLRFSYKRDWMRALRSGEYEQGRHFLLTSQGDNDRYCSLGVAADLFVDDDWVPANDNHTAWALARDPEGISFLSREIFACWFKPRCNNGALQRLQEKLADMNDNAGSSFVEIADWIEENL